MTKAIETLGLPTVNVCAIISISRVVGANRIVRAVSIPHPFGDPALSREDEFSLRQALVLRALHALETPIDSQTLF
jgi:betaine reductase